MAKKTNNQSGCCVLTLPLLTEPWQEHIIETRFRIMEHLKNSLTIFKAMEEKVKRYDYDYANRLIAEKKFEQLEMYVIGLIMGIN